MSLIAPSVIWAIDFEDGRGHVCPAGTIGCMAERGTFRWLHLSLADQVTRGWIAQQEMLPEEHGAAGPAVAGFLAMLASGAVYWVLRSMGLDGRNWTRPPKRQPFAR